MDLFRNLVGTQHSASTPPQAFTRVTHSPVWWNDLGDAKFGQTSNGEIDINSTKLPQMNANPEYMSNVLRHESVHALMPKPTIDGITSYFDNQPQAAETARTRLAQIDPDAVAAKGNQALAEEAPAYAVQGYRFGLPSESIITEYLKHMPEPIRQKYLRLLRPGGR